MVIKLQIFWIKKFQRWKNACLAIIGMLSALKKYENYYPQVFLRECKYTEKKIIRHIHDILSDFVYSFEAMRLESIEEAILEIYFEREILRKQIFKIF